MVGNTKEMSSYKRFGTECFSFAAIMAESVLRRAVHNYMIYI